MTLYQEFFMRHLWAANVLAIIVLHTLVATRSIRLKTAKRCAPILLACLAFTAGPLLFIMLNPATASSIIWADSFTLFVVAYFEVCFTFVGTVLMIRLLRQKPRDAA